MTQILNYIFSDDFSKSIDYYLALNFKIALDAFDGNGIRRVRLSPPGMNETVIALDNRSDLLKLSSQKGTFRDAPDVIFSIVTNDYSDWYIIAEKSHIAAEWEIVEPWGIWYYFRDPAGNLFAITNNMMR